MENTGYGIAYSEVLEVLKYIPKEDYEKVPKELINAMRENKDNSCKYKYNIRKTFEEQEISEEAKAVLAVLFRDYWATEKQREKILAKEKYDNNKLEQEKKEKFNPDNIFKHEETHEEEKENTEIVEYKKENILQKIFNKIKSIFSKLKK